jgi:tripartite-type tricarboxylate transporter receptor subunit TctC
MDYLMLRGIFMPAGVSQDVVDFYIGFFGKVRATEEWKKLMEDGAFNQSFMSGKEYVNWVAQAENTHRELMRDAGFLAKK